MADEHNVVPTNFEILGDVSFTDDVVLREKRLSYGDSWQKRGGVGAYMMLARKWDRLENVCLQFGYNIFDAVLRSDVVREGNVNPISVHLKKDGVLDDIRDLRRYLLLVETYLAQTEPAIAMSTLMRSNEVRVPYETEITQIVNNAEECRLDAVLSPPDEQPRVSDTFSGIPEAMRDYAPPSHPDLGEEPGPGYVHQGAGASWPPESMG